MQSACSKLVTTEPTVQRRHAKTRPPHNRRQIIILAILTILSPFPLVPTTNCAVKWAGAYIFPMMRPRPASSLQKTYDECYLACSTAVYFEGQVGCFAPARPNRAGNSVGRS